MSAVVSETLNTAYKAVDLISWIVIAAFAVAVALALFAGGSGAANFFRFAFPLGAVAVGAILYIRSSRHYLGFAWWIWFLTPFVRRVIDYRSQWVDPSPVLLAPFLVAFLSVFAMLRRNTRSETAEPQLNRRELLPFVFAIAGIAYALGVGLIKNPTASVAPMLLNWLVPVLFGFFFVAHWREYPQLRTVTQQCFLWMVLITGGYGICQFVFAPEWDSLWIVNGNNWASGSPEPLGIRVFSTLNSAGPFGIVISAGLLLLFANQSVLRYPAAAVGYLSFLLSLARSTWLGWSVGLLILFVSLPVRSKARLLAIMLVLLCCVVPLTTLEPFAETIGARFNTFNNVTDDVSYLDRVEGYELLVGKAVMQVFGQGLGSAGDDSTGLGIHDSTVLEMLFTLGWLGTVLYLCGLTFLIANLLFQHLPHEDTFVNAARAVCFGIFAQVLLGSVLIGVSGVIFWSFANIIVAARLYHSNHSNVY